MPRNSSGTAVASTVALLVGAMVFSVAPATSSEGADEPVAPAVTEAQLAEGEALYLKNCRFCHGTKGTSGKRLAGNENVEDGDYVAQVILTGPGYMTPFAEHLSDDEIAAIATYVRNSWGNAFGPVESATVASLR